MPLSPLLPTEATNTIPPTAQQGGFLATHSPLHAVFSLPAFQASRCFVNPTTEKVWFVARDIALALGYQNPAEAIRDHCEEVDILKAGKAENRKPGFPVPPRGYQIIAEPDVYNLLFHSHLPEAKKFRRWLCHEVLPAIRKHGMYATPATLDAMLEDPDTMIRALTALKEKRAALKQNKAIEAMRGLEAEESTFDV